MANLDSVSQSKDISLPTKVHLVKAMVFPVVCMDVKAGPEEGWASKNWCFQTVVLEKALESPLDSKEIKPVNPKGNQSLIFIGRTDAEAKAPVLWPPDVKSQLLWKEPDAGKDWGQEEKGTTEDEMVGWHHWLSGHDLSKLREMVKDREAWCAAVDGVRVRHNLETEQQQREGLSLLSRIGFLRCQNIITYRKLYNII